MMHTVKEINAISTLRRIWIIIVLTKMIDIYYFEPVWTCDNNKQFIFTFKHLEVKFEGKDGVNSN